MGHFMDMKLLKFHIIPVNRQYAQIHKHTEIKWNY